MNDSIFKYIQYNIIIKAQQGTKKEKCTWIYVWKQNVQREVCNSHWVFLRKRPSYHKKNHLVMSINKYNSSEAFWIHLLFWYDTTKRQCKRDFFLLHKRSTNDWGHFANIFFWEGNQLHAGIQHWSNWFSFVLLLAL